MANTQRRFAAQPADHNSSLGDVAPTVLDLMELGKPEDMSGKSLLQPAEWTIGLFSVEFIRNIWILFLVVCFLSLVFSMIIIIHWAFLFVRWSYSSLFWGWKYSENAVSEKVWIRVLVNADKIDRAAMWSR